MVRIALPPVVGILLPVLLSGCSGKDADRPRPTPSERRQSEAEAAQPGSESAKAGKSKYKPAVELEKLNGMFWTADWEAALERAEKDGKLVFISFVGQTDVNSRYNERATFTREKVKDHLRRYVLVQLYVDKVPDQLYREAPKESESEADAASNSEFQEKHFETVLVPFYVIVKPKLGDKFDIVATYFEGKINDEVAFIDFLHKPLYAAK